MSVANGNGDASGSTQPKKDVSVKLESTKNQIRDLLKLIHLLDEKVKHLDNTFNDEYFDKKKELESAYGQPLDQADQELFAKNKGELQAEYQEKNNLVSEVHDAFEDISRDNLETLWNVIYRF